MRKRRAKPSIAKAWGAEMEVEGVEVCAEITPTEALKFGIISA